MSRNAQGLTTSTLILIALGILILLIAIVFYTTISSNAKETATMCENLGGVCQSPSQQCSFVNRIGECPNNQVCCVGNT